VNIKQSFGVCVCLSAADMTFDLCLDILASSFLCTAANKQTNAKAMLSSNVKAVGAITAEKLEGTSRGMVRTTEIK